MNVPLTMEMAGQPVVCIGGGPVASAKVVPLAQAGAAVTVISPTCVDDLAAVVTWVKRPFAAGDLSGRPLLVVAATGIAAVDQAVADEAAAVGVWCLRIDGRGSVAMPSVIRRGGLLIAITTGAPALTRRLRLHVEAALDDRWAVAAKVLSALRADPEVRRALSPLSGAERRNRWRRAVDVTLGQGDQALPDRARAVLEGRRDG